MYTYIYVYLCIYIQKYIYVYICILYIYVLLLYNNNDVLMMKIYKNNSRYGDEESVCVYVLRVIVTCK